jgi:hypothetical protein
MTLGWITLFMGDMSEGVLWVPLRARHQVELADRPWVAMKLEMELASLHSKLQTRPLVRWNIKKVFVTQINVTSGHLLQKGKTPRLADWPSVVMWLRLRLRTVSNTDNVNILCKYLMYILTDYRLILTKDRPGLSSERADPSGTALARTSSNSQLRTRPLVREGATKYKPATV